MATKINSPYETMTVNEDDQSPRPNTVIVKIDGLHPRHDPYGTFELVLDKPMIRIDYSEVHGSLIKQGVDEETLNLAIEAMARFIEVRSLAMLLAKRIQL